MPTADKSPEDSAWWKKAGESKPPVTMCSQCKQQIVNWHCESPTCSWCAACGARAKNVKPS